MMANFPTRSRHAPRRVLALLRGLAPGIFILAFSVHAYSAGVTLSNATGGVSLSGNTAPFGTVNGLGVGAVAPPVLVTSGVSNGVFYYSPVNAVVSFTGSHTGSLTAYASTFSHPSALSYYICTTSCSSFSNYTPLPQTSGTATTLAASVGSVTVEFWVGVFVANSNGANAYAGGDSVGITLTATDSKSGQTGTVVLTVSLTAQTAVGLTLSDTNGLISAASDFAVNFHNVNGLGINPAPHISAMSVSGGYVYYIPYTITPVFSNFITASEQHPTLSVQLYAAFGSPTIIYLEDSATSGGPYSPITGTGTTITTTASSGTAVNRYLGLFVSNYNGAGAFTGTDSSTLTYTLLVH